MPLRGTSLFAPQFSKLPILPREINMGRGVLKRRIYEKALGKKRGLSLNLKIGETRQKGPLGKRRIF